VSRELLDQLGTYFSDIDARQGPVTAEQVSDVMSRVHELPLEPVLIRQRPRVWIAVVAAAVVIVAIGIVPLLVGSLPSEVPPATEAQSTTSPVAVTSTIAGPAEDTTALQVPPALSPSPPSADGTPLDLAALTWSRVAIPDDLFGDDEYVSEIVVVDSRLVLLGREDCDGDRYASVWTSEDGYIWQRLPRNEVFLLTPSGSPQCPVGFRDVVVGESGLVAVGEVAAPPPSNTIKAAVWLSADGLEWTRVSPDGDDASMSEYTRLWSVYLGGPGFVAVGEACELPTGGERTLCDEGEAEGVIWISPDGLTWTRIGHLPTEFAGTWSEPAPGSFIEITAADGEGLVGAVPTGRGFDFWTTQDGSLWIKVPTEDTAPRDCVQWLGSHMTANDEAIITSRTCNDPVASSDDRQPGWSQYYSTVWASPDGRSWNATTFEPGETIHDLVGTTAGFVAVGGIAENSQPRPLVADYEPVIWISPDGIEWTPIDLDPEMAGQGTLTRATIGGPGIVATGDSPEGPTLWIGTQPSP
jgi:hypothetical protein